MKGFKEAYQSIFPYFNEQGSQKFILHRKHAFNLFYLEIGAFTLPLQYLPDCIKFEKILCGIYVINSFYPFLNACEFITYRSGLTISW